MSSSTNVHGDEDDVLTEHSYDGILEYDNPLPSWWTTVFFFTVVFSAFYGLYYHAGTGPSMAAEYEAYTAKIFTMKFAELGELKPDRETLLKYSQDKKWLSVGQAVFKTNCISCHGPEGLGATGPNLTDNYWKNVEHIEDIAKVVNNGAANGAMPAWGRRLSHPNQIVLVAAYVASLRGSQPSGTGLEPYGNEIPDWGESAAAETDEVALK